MHATKELIFSWLGKTKLEVIVSVQCSRSEFAFRAVDRVGNVIVIDPDYASARLYCYGSWHKGKVVDVDLGYSII